MILYEHNLKCHAELKTRIENLRNLSKLFLTHSDLKFKKFKVGWI